MNTPLAGAVTTGEHALSLLMSLARKIPAADASIRAGNWKKSLFTGVELQGKQLGVVGLGQIGRVVATKAAGIGMTIAAYDPFVTQSKAPDGVRMLDLDELLATSDFVTVHVPLLKDTHHLLNRDRLFAMKKGARLIHAARGGIVCEAGLCEALTEGHLAGAALDVFEKEPLAEDNPLRTAPNLILTPHLGASTVEAKRNVSLDMANQIGLAIQKGVVLNGVNVAKLSPADALQAGPYMDLARNLASVLTQTFIGELVQLMQAQHKVLPALLFAASASRSVGAEEETRECLVHLLASLEALAAASSRGRMGRRVDSRIARRGACRLAAARPGHAVHRHVRC